MKTSDGQGKVKTFSWRSLLSRFAVDVVVDVVAAVCKLRAGWLLPGPAALSLFRSAAIRLVVDLRLASLALLDCCKAAPTSDKNTEQGRWRRRIRRESLKTATDERHPTPQNSSFKVKKNKTKQNRKLESFIYCPTLKKKVKARGGGNPPDISKSHFDGFHPVNERSSPVFILLLFRNKFLSLLRSLKWENIFHCVAVYCSFFFVVFLSFFLVSFLSFK